MQQKVEKRIDPLTPAQRKLAMSRVRQKDTPIEVLLRSALHRKGLRFRKNVRKLPGSPDIVISSARLAIFVDGDFWHGYQFPKWEHKLTPFWREKIRANRQRDCRNFSKLRRDGWSVMRFWGHEVLKDVNACAERVKKRVTSINEISH